MRQLHWDGWVRLDGGMPEWELRRFAERLHRRYCGRIVEMLERWRNDWMKGDDEDSAPGADRPGGLVARRVSTKLKGAGIFVYAAHPSQRDDAEDDYEYSGPRWYVTCTEAVMRHYEAVGVAPPPPAEMQEILWPRPKDRRKPWLTEMGWTLVPEGSEPQVMHADICSSEADKSRRPGRGRYHHFAWKPNATDLCTTNVVPGAFSEGCATWEDYNNWTQVRGNAIIFDSEMLHRGGITAPGSGWTSTLTLQVCSGSGWPALHERVSEGLMWYTQQMGWEEGAAVDANVGGPRAPSWRRAIVERRDETTGRYTVRLDSGEAHADLDDSELRYRQPVDGDAGAGIGFALRQEVEALADGVWLPARVARANGDGTYRIVWLGDLSFTDGLPAASLRAAAPRKPKRRRPSSDAGAPRDDSPLSSAPSSASTQLPGGDGAARTARRRVASAVGGAGATEAEACAAPPLKRRRAAAVDAEPTGEPVRADLVSRGYVEFKDGLPDHLKWELFEFVEDCYDRFSALVIQELESLRDFWAPCSGSCERYGAFAAAKATERLEELGVAVYSPSDSQSQDFPYVSTGPRWYVSVTPRALRHYGAKGVPGPPAELWELLCGHEADVARDLRARGLGWTLAPAGSDPQALHADIYGEGAHRRSDPPGRGAAVLGDGCRTRWPHVLWKRRRGELCTTELVPGAFTEGQSEDRHFDMIRRVRAPLVIMDSEALHRGSATSGEGGWSSTLSLELCTASGWAAWEGFMTGGTTKDPCSDLDWRMLRIRRPRKAAAGAPEEPKGDAQRGDGSSGVAPKGNALAAVTPATLPPAPWSKPQGRARLAEEQRKFEGVSGAA